MHPWSFLLGIIQYKMEVFHDVIVLGGAIGIEMASGVTWFEDAQ